MSLAITEGNVMAALRAAPDEKLSYQELLQKFGNRVQLLTLLWSMRDDPECPLTFNQDWTSVAEITVHLVQSGERSGRS